ncbi:unnamed protein product [Clonostachys byssicola]|uniref:Beta-galactosidase n=1 Tax=Clonostachys byssicola TaxID=160290 RepID=A0A9N9Y3Q9_9HYPO|nr:unnamed protein product [Clonostachys byssicola]
MNLLQALRKLSWGCLLLQASNINVEARTIPREVDSLSRQRISLNQDWKFWRSESIPDGLAYEDRPIWNEGGETLLKDWVLPSVNEFIADESKHHEIPDQQPNTSVPYKDASYDDNDWESITLPHDWAIKGPFYTDKETPIDAGMGRLPTQGVAWYRRKLTVDSFEENARFYLDIDGAMSYSTVWINGKLVGGWPYGYTSYRTDITSQIIAGEENQIAIRVENPPSSSRWYSGGGIYRNVWLTKTSPVHVAHWGTQITTEVSEDQQSAAVNLTVQVENKDARERKIDIITDIYEFDAGSEKRGKPVASFEKTTVTVQSNSRESITVKTEVLQPKLWGPPPTQSPNLYLAVTRLVESGKDIDSYDTEFGIRTIIGNGEGLLVNGERLHLRGVDQHHDLGALGAAFNWRAAERQLEILRDFGTNAVRMSHNPPAPELLQLADRLGFLVIDEIFDAWLRSKKSLDYHLLFNDWHEADLRALLRRDRNHPSVIIWSVGNEVGEQTHDDESTPILTELGEIVREEDATRPFTIAKNSAKPYHAVSKLVDVIALNYQGEGRYDTPAYSHLGSPIYPQHPEFHKAFPEKLLLSAESASAISSRDSYLFPIVDVNSSPTNDSAGAGGNSSTLEVNAYELYSVDWGSSADKVFSVLDKYDYVAGEFVWTGFDYIGEPTPYDSKPNGDTGSRSSYFGIVDLAGFKKDRFYLYQAHWRPENAMAHILPHWNWPDREGLVTPVHVFTSGDEAELFLNNESLGRKKKGEYEYRIRWDDVVYAPGEVRVVAYKDGQEWATETVRTTGQATSLRLSADRNSFSADGKDLSFVTVEVVDKNGDVVRDADVTVKFGISGSGEILATDNGWQSDYVAFPSKERKVVGGLALAIVGGTAGSPGAIEVTATADGLSEAKLQLSTQ